MKVIDLSKIIENGMDVYAGDPPVHITDVRSLEKDSWRVKDLHFGSHTGTHMDAPAHMHEHGMRVDEIPLDRCFGRAMIAEPDAVYFPQNMGLIFKEGNIDAELYEKISAANPTFVVTGDDASLSIELERQLLEDDILTFTDLINLSELPEDREVIFFGIPLKIKEGDGSPIRAFAVVD